MFVKFIIVMIGLTAANLEIEGGREAIEEKGIKASIEQAIKEREPLDYSKLND